MAIPAAEPVLPGRMVTTHDLLPLMLALFGDEIRTRLHARIDTEEAAEQSLRLDPDEKRKRVAELHAEIFHLQHEEAALRVLLAGDSPEIAFRAEMDPLAILGIEITK